MWECGLKQKCLVHHHDGVTPYVGVWIETCTKTLNTSQLSVTPYVGVWIETRSKPNNDCTEGVTPYVGVWIETRYGIG